MDKPRQDEMLGILWLIAAFQAPGLWSFIGLSIVSACRLWEALRGYDWSNYD